MTDWLDEAVIEAARGDFTAFKMLMWGRYMHAPHLELIDYKLMQVLRYVITGGAEGIGKVMFELPPRHGKSQSISKFFPPYFLGHSPDKRVMVVSYGESLAVKASRYARGVIRTPLYQYVFPGIALAQDSKAKNAWDLEGHDGGLEALGKGGSATGKGADLLITDDLVKNREEAQSPVMRDKDEDFLNDDLRTRLEPGGAHISVMTRWHNDDVHGRMQRYENDWDIVSLPALARENDPLGRKQGEALWPARFPVDVLLKIKKQMGEWSFAGLYQQAPQPESGGLFKRDKFHIIDGWPRDARGNYIDLIRVVRFWDLALSEKTSADYTVGVLGGISRQGRIVVLEVDRFQVEWDDVPDRIEAVALRDGPGVHVGVETAFFQTRAVKKLLAKPNLHSFVIRGYRPDTDKYTRALPFAARVGEDMVDVVRGPWLEDYLSELTSFYLGSHDDQVDASSGMYLMLDNAPITSEVRERI